MYLFISCHHIHIGYVNIIDTKMYIGLDQPNQLSGELLHKQGYQLAIAK